MPRALTAQESQEFLAERQVGVVSVASDAGRPPLTVPIWYSYPPGGMITFFTGTQGRRARKIRLIRAAGAVSFLVQHAEFPYKYVVVEGTVVQVDHPPSAEQMLPIARRYLPEEQAQAFVNGELGRSDSELTLYTIRPDRWLSTDFG